MSSNGPFERIVRDYGPALRRLVAAWERDLPSREDLLQEILFALWRALPTFRGEASERTFVFRVALNRVLTHRSRRPPVNEPLEAASQVSDPAETPEAEATSAERWQQLVRALQALSPAMRQILMLGLEGLSGAEIGDVLGTSENNANVRLSRARRALRQQLKRREQELTRR